MTKREIIINNNIINDESNCFVIAEIGHNHQGNIETCKKLFKAAKDSGANAVKLQKRDIESLYTKEFYNTPYEGKNSYGQIYGLHRKALEFNKDEYLELKKYAEEINIIFFATAFDFKSVDFLLDIEVPCFKVASSDLTNIPLLKYIAKTGKPIIISTGASNLEDIKRTYNEIININKNLAFLQCTATYPSNYSELDLNVISQYRSIYPDNVIGFSSHNKNTLTAVIAYTLGARIIEKHFTLSNDMKGTDHAFSLTPSEMTQMVNNLKITKESLGNKNKTFYDKEKNALYKMGKKIVSSKNLDIGHTLTESDFEFKTPGDGLPPYLISDLIGKVLKISIKKDESFTLKHI